jgi:hypothetical protein
MFGETAKQQQQETNNSEMLVNYRTTLHQIPQESALPNSVYGGGTYFNSVCGEYVCWICIKNSGTLVRQRTTSAERPPPFGKVSVDFSR